MDLLADLTPSQRAAVSHKDGPLLVVAGAGSGKTRVITRRVAWLVEQGVPSRNILAITFTNKAAGEMRSRVEKLLGTGGKSPFGKEPGPTVSTFHSLCARLLRRWAKRVGFEPSFAILDAADQRAAVREALIEVAADPKLFAPPKVAQAIARAKDRLESPKDLAARAASRFEQVCARAFEVYSGLLKQRNALDFDDLLGKTVELVREHEDAREWLQDRFRYVLIDEYQDTNHAQYELAKGLAASHKNICATGDPDQSIYGWRGADIENILRFEADYPGCKVVLLERNYRSTKTVCRAANGLIAHNTRRKEKVLTTENDEGAPLEVFTAQDESGEARWVAGRIASLLKNGTSPEEVAVFYRANALSRAVEQALFESGIAHTVVGALSFYERKEVKDVLAYLRVLANPRDDASLLRVLQTPPRGIGKTSLSRLKAFAETQSVPLADALPFAHQVSGISKRARGALAEAGELFERLRQTAREGSAESVVRAVVDETRYLAYLQEEYPEEEDRPLNVEALVAGAHEFDKRAREAALARAGSSPPQKREQTPVSSKKTKVDSPQKSLFREESREETESAPSPDIVDDASGETDDDFLLSPLEPGIQGFLEQVALMAEEDAQREEDLSGKVSLMTVHTAKGLEFDAVFLIGLEDGIFPNARAQEESLGLEEERRLCYVAITRARKRLFLTHASWRTRFGRSDERIPSGFLFELPDDVFEAGKKPRGHMRAQDPFPDDDFQGEGEGSTLSRRRPLGGFDEDDIEGSPELADVESEPRRLWNRPLSSSEGRLSSPPPPGTKSKDTSGETARRLLENVAARARPDADETVDWKEGDRVRHEHFGLGKVLSVSGQGPGKRVRVNFYEFGEKTLVVVYARLAKVSS